MPRKRRTTAAVLEPLTSDDGRVEGQILPTPLDYDGTDAGFLAARLESVPAPEIGDSVVSRLYIADMITAAEHAGVDVPVLLRNYAPSLQDILEEHRRISEIKSQAEKDLEVLRKRIIDRMDQDAVDDLAMDIGGEMYRIPMPGKESLNKVRYVELGGDLDLLERATEAGTPFYQLRYRKPKEAK
jgi:hypothetical protein